MLLRVKVGRDSEVDTLVLTPEFIDFIKRTDRSYRVYLRTRFYPWVKNWLVISSISGKLPPDVSVFSFRSDGQFFSIFIPIKQCAIFDGKVIGRAMDIVNSPLGFLEA